MAKFTALKSGVLVASLLAIPVLANGCSAAQSVQQASAGCSGLSASASQAQAAILAWTSALSDLNTAATKLEADWLNVCNEMNGALGQDTTQTTASAACNVLSAYINADLQKGVTVSLNVGFDCQANVSAQATCEAQAGCTVTPVTCTGGDVVVGCNGSCSAACDVTAPSFACSGTCKGECTASAAVSCTGSCTGTCDAPSWSGTCDAGCTATFSGSCGGNCSGTCDGTNVSGAACKGTCAGTCDAKASGSCAAKCTGTFSGGTCSGNCTGKCNVAAGASCSGTCNGTCTYTPGSATCSGTCHGSCSATTTPPTCTGSLNCGASASCQGQASASVSCPPPQVTVAVTGDALLATAYQQFSSDLGTAINETVAIKQPIGTLASNTLSTFQALGDVGAGGAACIASQATAISNVQASLSVSVSASASVSGSAG